jgi:hypothetical protein
MLSNDDWVETIDAVLRGRDRERTMARAALRRDVDDYVVHVGGCCACWSATTTRTSASGSAASCTGEIPRRGGASSSWSPRIRRSRTTVRWATTARAGPGAIAAPGDRLQRPGVSSPVVRPLRVAEIGGGAALPANTKRSMPR